LIPILEIAIYERDSNLTILSVAILIGVVPPVTIPEIVNDNRRKDRLPDSRVAVTE
jgi:hypothetical protein